MISWQFLMFIVIILTALGTIVSKKTLFKEHAMEFSATLSFILALLSLPLLPFVDFTFPSSYWPLLYIVSLFATIGFLLVAKATRHLDISSSSPLFAFSPVITAVLALFFLNEQLTSLHITGLGLVFIGSYFLEMKPRKSMLKEMLTPIKIMMDSKYIHFMFIALFLYGIGDIVERFMLNTSNPNNMTVATFFFIIHIFMAINFIILLAVYHDGFVGIKHGIKSAGFLIFIMALIAFSGRFITMYAVSIPAAQIALVAALKRGSIVLSTFFGGELFKDKHIKQRTLAALVMVAGAILVAL